MVSRTTSGKRSSDRSQLSSSHEDYLRAIWKLNEWQDHPVTLTELTRTLKLSPSTVSEGIQRLVTKGLVRHARYGKIALTDEGRAEAARMVRIHRLLETGLVTIFGYSWDEVHEEAERLEHAVSDVFISRLDAVLDHPTHDPHGDSIPSADGNIVKEGRGIPLNRLSEGENGTITRVSDIDSDALRTFDELTLIPGTRVSILSISSEKQTLLLKVEPSSPQGTQFPDSPSALHEIEVPLSIAHLIAVEPHHCNCAKED